MRLMLNYLKKKSVDRLVLVKLHEQLASCTSVDPVNETLLMSMCSDMAAPAVGP